MELSVDYNEYNLVLYADAIIYIQFDTGKQYYDINSFWCPQELSLTGFFGILALKTYLICFCMIVTHNMIVSIDHNIISTKYV